MSSQAYLPDTWPVFAGLKAVCWDGSPTNPYPVDVWLSAWGAPNAGVPLAWWGAWPGDPRCRPMWPHGFTGSGTHIIVHYWDMILGDGQLIDETTFRASRSVVALYTGAVGTFVPYL